MEKSLKSIATNWGLFLGALLAGIIVVAYAVNLDLLNNMWVGIFILVAIIAFGIISVAKVKQAQDSFASFKEAFTSFFLTALIGLVIYTLLTFVLFSVIDTEAGAVLKEKTIENRVEMMKGFNTPIDDIAKYVEQMETQNIFSLLNMLKGLAIYLVLFSIIGLIVAAAMKKSKPAIE
ncbi:DUF4199 domain-containing protein [Aestuariibaculum sp. M13]|uniref:DUF4199 domain-containing protein n=1 Tax=Aestuariibaculum sp. M13 TaxID=2967132 RepID=UPI002159C607|nr:DUF4199 domain-containing protein [Aestuariibaculum sp. M13]MCR8668569.1 DUF4199 domain-containing protein [Aestuariibaculum sp. M13]